MENKRKSSIIQFSKTTNLWQEILREAMEQKELDDTSLFVFGDNMSGKRYLLKGIKNIISDKDEDKKDEKKDQRTEEIAKFSLMDYTFLNIINSADKNSEIIGKLNVWIVNSFINKEEIMAMLKKKKINNIMCLIVVDLARPWKIKESINKWTAFIQEVFKDEQSDIMEIMQKNGKKKFL
jgi:hypothetical protein